MILWILAALGAMSVLNFVLNYCIWVVLCDLVNQDRSAREWESAAGVFAKHLHES